MTPPTTDLDARVRAKRAERFGGTPAGTPPRPAPTKGKPAGDRWRTLNQFSDSIEPHLSLAERAVWQKMFRRARDGQCQTTARKLAAAMGINKATVSRALATLTGAGLVWVIWHARDKGRDSCYGIHATPGDCLPKLLRRAPK